MPAQIDYLCGADIGGTFTDLVLVDLARGKVYFEKILTTGEDPSEALVAGLSALMKRLPEGSEAHGLRLVHATTLLTNALIERRGARTALLTTKGFGDVMDFRRENRFDIFDLAIRFPDPIIPKDLRWEVAERMDYEGNEIEPLDEAALAGIGREMAARGVESVAVAFLHSYENSAHEMAAAKAIAPFLPGGYVTSSGEVAPIIREYERFSTTAVNAFTMPIVDDYLGTLRQRVGTLWPDLHLSMMVSNGGICSPETARRFPVRLLESGPAAGVLVAAHFGQAAGCRDLLAFDMGGTTAKLCVVTDGEPTMVDTFEAARTARFRRGSGIPIRAPSVDLVEIGAGGGSIAWIDQLGLLQVGPRSAGASPGPACYGLGGTEPTVTDAAVLLGYINPDAFLGGRMQLDVAAAAAAIKRHVADPLQISVEEAAWGIHELVVENMSNAAWLHMAEKGLDPRTHVLVATGGAGPVHASRLAVKLGIRHILCPPVGGVDSAFGLLVAPPRADVARSFITTLQKVAFDRLNALFAELQQQALDVLLSAGVERHQVRFERFADMLYHGQTHHIEVRLPAGTLGEGHREAIVASFSAAYMKMYGAHLPGVTVDMVAIRVVAIAPAGELRRDLFDAPVVPESGQRTRQVFLGSEKQMRAVPAISRGSIPASEVFHGPSVIESSDTSIVVEPGWQYYLDAACILHIERTRPEALDG